jgi:hypothetical protein
MFETVTLRLVLFKINGKWFITCLDLMDFNKRRENAFDRILASKPELSPLLFFFSLGIESAQRNPFEKPRLTAQRRTELEPSAVGRQASALSFYVARLTLYVCHLFGIRRLVPLTL